MARGRGLALVGGMVIGGAMARSRVRGQQLAYEQGQQAERQSQQQTQQQIQLAQLQAQQQTPQQAPTAAPRKDIIVELQKLGDLHKSGILTDEEFTAAKKKLLG